jgi:hypothetical protein
VLRRTAHALIASTLFGLLYQGLGARFLQRDLHPDYTVFHYATHLTVTTFYLFVGWTALLESKQLLPTDSVRGVVTMALLGEVLLWHKHAAMKPTAIDQDLHEYLALSSGMTAISIGLSVFLGNGTLSKNERSAPTCIAPLVAYLGGFLGFIHQGLWFLIIALHQKYPIGNPEYVTIFFCLLTLLVALFGQGILVRFIVSSPCRGKTTGGMDLRMVVEHAHQVLSTEETQEHCTQRVHTLIT